MKAHLDDLEALPIELVTQSLWDGIILRLREVETQALRFEQYVASLKGAIEVIRREDSELLREAQSRYSTAVEALEAIANGDGESALWAKQALSDLGLRL